MKDRAKQRSRNLRVGMGISMLLSCSWKHDMAHRKSEPQARWLLVMARTGPVLGRARVEIVREPCT